MSKSITHEGVVTKIEGSQVSVLIVQHSACSGCHARGACTASDQKEKIILVEIGPGEVYKPGERVMLVGSNSMAWSALTYAFIIPLVASMVVLFVVALTVSEKAGALSVVGILAVYYFILYLLRNKMKTKFTFSLQKLDA